MRTIKVPSKAIPRGSYAQHTAENGHTPGVLSGSELSSKQKGRGAWYAKQRKRVAEALALFGVRNRIVLMRTASKVQRECRVWTDEYGKRVRVVLIE